MISPEWWLILAALIAALAWRRRRLQVQAVDLEALAVVLGRTAACLRAGLPATVAVAAALDGCPPPLRDALEACGTAAHPDVGNGGVARLGASAGVDEQMLARAAALLAEAPVGGSAMSGRLTRLAQDLRRIRRDRSEMHSRRAGVLMVLPLGSCFLPAFVLAGVVPLVVLLGRDLAGEMTWPSSVMEEPAPSTGRAPSTEQLAPADPDEHRTRVESRATVARSGANQEPAMSEDKQETMPAEASTGQSGEVRSDAGMSTAEYAVGTVAAVAFAGILFKVISSDTVRSALGKIVAAALTIPF